VKEGRGISQVAPLSLEELAKLVREDQVARLAPPVVERLDAASASGILEETFRAVREMDPSELERSLRRGAMALPVPTLLDEVVTPLLSAIGVGWRKGELGPAHEHVASVVVRRFLEWFLAVVGVGGDAPVLVVATPAGERHEMGALLAAGSAAAEGWRALYLGPDLPAKEIAFAAVQVGAQVVALSLLNPTLARRYSEEIREVRQALPDSTRIVIGGAPEVLNQLGGSGDGVEFLGSLAKLREELRRTAPAVLG